MEITEIKNKVASEGMTLVEATVPVSTEKSIIMFRKKCEENICGCYDKSWTCPPAVGSPRDCARELIGFDKAVIIFKRYGNVNVKDRAALERIAREHQDSCRAVKRMFVGEGIEELTLCEGPCQFCDKCSYPGPCMFPDEQIPSASGYGIDMGEYLGSNGIDLKFSDSEVTLYGIVLFRGR